jgi:sigma-B regulation protein RsbU (phosphoserine phosphatase)
VDHDVAAEIGAAFGFGMGGVERVRIANPQGQMEETVRVQQFDWYWASAGKWSHWRVYPAPEGLAVFSADATDRKAAEYATQAYLERQENIAETLQRSLLASPQSYDGIEIASYYEAAYSEAKIGGDFYDEFRIDETCVALVVGDVVGKGLTAATHTAEVKFALRAILREDPRAGVAMERLNSYLVEAQHLDDTPNDKLVALSLAVWDRATGHVSVALAAAEAPMIVSPQGQVSYMGVHGMVLGASAKSEYTAATKPLPPGHSLIMLTDGVTEARKGKEFFGLDGVEAAIQRAGTTRSLDDLGEAIVADAKAFAGGTLKDDACVLLARVT